MIYLLIPIAAFTAIAAGYAADCYAVLKRHTAQQDRMVRLLRQEQTDYKKEILHHLLPPVGGRREVNREERLAELRGRLGH